jgi:hypothetical protein
VMGVILSEFALIPFMETRRPSTLLLVIQNMLFSGFSVSHASHILAKVSTRSEM